MKTVLQVSARRIVCEEGKTRLGWLPHACLLVQPLEELINCGGAVKANHLEMGRGPESADFLRDCHWGWHRVSAGDHMQRNLSLLTVNWTWTGPAVHLMLLSGPVFQLPCSRSGSRSPTSKAPNGIQDTLGFKLLSLYVH